ncbi:MAG: bifunctional phosphoglucose/phosphomannose isomerase [Fimbriimonadales bacterium]
MEPAAILDNPLRLAEHDPKGMMGLALAFPQQCEEAISIYRSSGFQRPQKPIQNVVVCGMGGSAAGGDLLRCVAEDQGTVPVVVCREYELPGFAGEETWAVFCSYSGNTEETLSCFEQAGQRGCQRLCITSGGKLGELAERERVQVIAIPGGQPPRTALGYLFLPLLLAAGEAGVVSNVNVEYLVSDLERIRDAYGPAVPLADNGAKWLASELDGRIPILYGLGGYRGVVASRWKCQINENSKMHAFAHVLPEMNHNEIVGWTRARAQSDKFSVVLLFDGTESERMHKRWEVTRSLIEPMPVHGIMVDARDLVTRMLSMCYLGDFVSLYLAALGETDPEEIAAINKLKAELAKLDG